MTYLGLWFCKNSVHCYLHLLFVHGECYLTNFHIGKLSHTTSFWHIYGIWEYINTVLRIELIIYRREWEPNASILDCQSVTTVETTKIRGYDVVKKVKGRKRHILLMYLGPLLMIGVHTADIRDRDCAKIALEQAKRYSSDYIFLSWSWAFRKTVDWIKMMSMWIIEIVSRREYLGVSSILLQK